MSPVQKLAEILIKRQWKLATAESCTGGMIASSLTDVAGSSEWFERGYVTYSNDAKHQDIGVDMALINQYGAVSIEVAQAMAQGALKTSHAQVALATTGVAGPTGGSVDKPVGLVCFAWAWMDQSGTHCVSSKRSFLGSEPLIHPDTRHEVRVMARDYAMEELVKLLSDLN